MHDKSEFIIGNLSEEEISKLLLVYPMRHKHSMAHDTFSLIWNYIELTEMVETVEIEK